MIGLVTLRKILGLSQDSDISFPVPNYSILTWVCDTESTSEFRRLSTLQNVSIHHQLYGVGGVRGGRRPLSF